MKTVIVNNRTYVEFWHRCCVCHKHILVRFEEALAEAYREQKQYCQKCATAPNPFVTIRIVK